MWSYGSQTDIRVAGGLQFHPIKSKSYQTGTTHWHSPISLRHLGVSQALSSATTFVSTLTPVSQISNCGLIVGDALCNMASPLFGTPGVGILTTERAGKQNLLKIETMKSSTCRSGYSITHPHFHFYPIKANSKVNMSSPTCPIEVNIS